MTITVGYFHVRNWASLNGINFLAPNLEFHNWTLHPKFLIEFIIN